MSSKELTISVKVKCPLCKKDYTVDNVPRQRYLEWRDGGSLHIQDALPELSADDRESLISGVCKTCWNNMFCRPRVVSNSRISDSGAWSGINNQPQGVNTMSEINAQQNATETEAKNFYEWLESNKAGFDNFMSKVYDDSMFPPAISNNAVAKFKIVNRALKDTIYSGHALMFSAAILWDKVKPTLTPEQIEQFKQADLKMVSGNDLFDMIAGIAGKDEATRQMKDCIDKSERNRIRSREEVMQEQRDQCEQKQVDVPTCPTTDPKDYSV